jgi:hypothetical protein
MGLDRQPVGALGKTTKFSTVKPRTSRALIYANLFDGEGEEIIPRALRL